MTITKFREISFVIIITSLATILLTIPLLCIYTTIRKGADVSSILVTLGIIEIILTSLLLLLILINRNAHQKQLAEEKSVPTSVPAVHEYLETRKQHQENESQLTVAKYAVVKDYVQAVLSPYMKEDDVITVCNNIHAWIYDDQTKLKAVSTDGRLTSIDLRHFAWNIGERFGWSGEKRAIFIKIVFPIEMKDTEVDTIRRNLRQVRTCIIDLDIPQKGDYKFSFES